ncbi:MAG TPA: T9SS type A sorting domain-containing protein [Phaeodactylibacter sp.]|nr:T9SS type A sorting domain-containing protein [Phaeodactylibacter sp.]
MGFCPPYSENNSAQAITILNQNMTSFAVMNRTSLSPVPATADPASPAEYYNYMTGNWRDGTPFSYGGDGYGGNQTTSFLYPDNPNDPNGWSMVSANVPNEDIRCMGNFALNNSLAPNESTTLDMAFTFYQDENTSNFEIVNRIYEQTPILQEIYNNSFEAACTANFCLDDCVWTGDANRDSMVNHLDILQIGLGLGATGTPRNKPPIWQPFDSPDWNQTADNVNLKHTDCDGNGIINHSDFAWVDWFYNKSYKIGTTPDTYHYGNEISIISDPDFPIDPLIYGTTGKAIIQLNQVEDLYGLAFTLEWNTAWTAFGVDWDTSWIDLNFGIPSSPWDVPTGNFRLLNKHNNEKAEAEFAFVKTDNNNSLTENSNIVTLSFKTKYNDYALIQAPLRIKNIKAILSDGTELDYGSKDFVIDIVNPNGTGEILPTQDLETTSIHIFPNPTSNFLNVKLEKPTAARFIIFDIYGKKVFEKPTTIKQNIQLSTEHLTSGIYFLNIEMNGKEWVQKFVKM